MKRGETFRYLPSAVIPDLLKALKEINILCYNTKYYFIIIKRFEYEHRILHR